MAAYKNANFFPFKPFCIETSDSAIRRIRMWYSISQFFQFALVLQYVVSRRKK